MRVQNAPIGGSLESLGHALDCDKDGRNVLRVDVEQLLLEQRMGDQRHGEVNRHERMSRQKGIHQASGGFWIVYVVGEPGDHPRQTNRGQFDLCNLQRIMHVGVHLFHQWGKQDAQEPVDVGKVLPHGVSQVAATNSLENLSRHVHLVVHVVENNTRNIVQTLVVVKRRIPVAYRILQHLRQEFASKRRNRGGSGHGFGVVSEDD
mmetsp:Transcript_11805/g.33903  ORF Transcript_11805/g.33903 Transcript_11805/m.33903 type:complete len:205 (-) Transcript_11805:832-1446(-)